MDYGQYTSLSHFGIHHQPQAQYQEQEQAQVVQHQQVQQVLQQLPQLRQEQLQHLQQEQQNFNFVGSSPQHLQVQALPTTSPTSTASLGYAPPAPWDSPLDSLGTSTPTSALAGFGDDAQFAAAAAMSMTMAYAYPQHDTRGARHGLLPPITTLEMADASTPTSGAATTPAASPMAVRTELAMARPTDVQQAAGQVQPQPQPQAQQVQSQNYTNSVAGSESQSPPSPPKEQARYQPPQVIKLVERPPRRTRTHSKAVSQSPRAQARARKIKQQQQQREKHEQSQRQHVEQEQRQEQQSASSRSAVNSPVEHQKQQQTVQSRSSGAGSDPPALVTNVPSPEQWSDVHTLGASLSRVGAGTGGKSFIESADSPRAKARDASHPYTPRLRQRRTVSGPAVLNGAQMHTQSEMSGMSNAPSPSTSLPTRSPVSISATTSNRSESAGPTPLKGSATTSRYLVRTDVHYDLENNTVTAMLEIPGVPRAAVRVALGDDGRTGSRLLVVRGRMRRIAFPASASAKEEGENASVGMKGKEEAGYIVKERKCGEFKRVLVVPPETKTEDIRVSMADGILFLRYPAGPQSFVLTAQYRDMEAQDSKQYKARANLNTLLTPARPTTSEGGVQINFRVQQTSPGPSFCSSSSSSSRADSGANANVDMNDATSSTPGSERQSNGCDSK